MERGTEREDVELLGEEPERDHGERREGENKGQSVG